jgi:hypothetical protein
MADAIAISKGDIRGMRTFSRFKPFIMRGSKVPRKFVVKFERMA